MRQTRKHIGAHFSEGARLLWEKIDQLRITAEDVRRGVGAGSGVVQWWLYGDKRPGIVYAQRLEESFGVPMVAWTQEPTAKFVPPAARKVAA